VRLSGKAFGFLITVRLIHPGNSEFHKVCLWPVSRTQLSDSSLSVSGTSDVVFQALFPSSFHFPAALGSTVITRFIATTAALTSAGPGLPPRPPPTDLLRSRVLSLPCPSPPTTTSTPCSSLRCSEVGVLKGLVLLGFTLCALNALN